MTNSKSPYTVEGWKLFILEDLIPILLSLKKFEVIREKIIKGEIDKKLLLEILLSEREKEDEIPASEIIWKILGIELSSRIKEGIKIELSRRGEIKLWDVGMFKRSNINFLSYENIYEKFKNTISEGIKSLKVEEEIKKVFNISSYSSISDFLEEVSKNLKIEKEAEELIADIKKGGERFLEETKNILEKLINLLPISNEFSYFLLPFYDWRRPTDYSGGVWLDVFIQYIGGSKNLEEIKENPGFGIKFETYGDYTFVKIDTWYDEKLGFVGYFGKNLVSLLKHLCFLLKLLLEKDLLKKIFPLDVNPFDEWSKQVSRIIKENKEILSILKEVTNNFYYYPYFEYTVDSILEESWRYEYLGFSLKLPLRIPKPVECNVYYSGTKRNYNVEIKEIPEDVLRIFSLLQLNGVLSFTDIRMTDEFLELGGDFNPCLNLKDLKE